jgi:hypothetical protein
MAWWAPSSRGASTGNRSHPTGLDIDAHYTLLTHENEAIEVVSQGLRRATDKVAARLTRGDQVDPDEYYFRTLVRLATPAPRLSWLNNLIAVSTGRRDKSLVRIDVHEVL